MKLTTVGAPDKLSCDTERPMPELTNMRGNYCFPPPPSATQSSNRKKGARVLRTPCLPIGPETDLRRRVPFSLAILFGSPDLLSLGHVHLGRPIYAIGLDYQLVIAGTAMPLAPLAVWLGRN